MGLLALRAAGVIKASPGSPGRGKHSRDREDNASVSSRRPCHSAVETWCSSAPAFSGPNGEEQLPSFEALREADPFPEQVAEQSCWAFRLAATSAA